MALFNIISRKYIEKSLSESPYKIKIKNCVSSTNTIMKSLAHKGEEEFSVLIAWRQTAGRGRTGRTFHSPGKTGVYMSILLKPGEDYNPLYITTDTAVCCCRVFENMANIPAKIKWVNDIYMNDRKVCGILTEGTEGGVVLGIGINILEPKGGFPEDIKKRAGAVFKKKRAYLREDVIISLLRALEENYLNPDRKQLIEEYKSRSIMKNKEIIILGSTGDEKATALEIADDYSLIVKKENGEICNLSTGDVSIKI